jgi:hypothetical protein
MSDETAEKDDPPVENPENTDTEHDPDAPGNAFPSVVSQFHSTMVALRELLEVLAPHVVALDEKRFQHGIGQTLEGVPPEKLKILADFFRDAADEMEADGAEAASAGRGAPIKIELDLSEVFDDNPRLASKFIDQWIKSFSRPPSSQILNRSMLAMAVGAFEVLLAGVLTEHYRLHPAALGGDEKEFSLDDLTEYGSIDDAREALIARRVDAKMRDSFEEWCRWFEKNLHLDFGELSADLDAIAEAFQRRHLIVHSAGEISRQYNDRARRAGRPELPLGMPVDITDEYLSQALDQLGTLGILVCLKAWSAWVPDHPAPGGMLLDRVFEMMVAGRWHAAESLCKASAVIPSSNDYQQLALKVNHWLCRKRLRGVDDVRDEVTEWDTSPLKTVFALARYALLDDIEAAYRLLPPLVESGELTQTDLVEWPLLEELRADPRFGEFDTRPKADERIPSHDTPPAAADED